MKLGAKLKNGAVLIARSLADRDGWRVVLAIRPKPQEYAIWNADHEGNCQSGEYCLVWHDAVTAYETRRKKHDTAVILRPCGCESVGMEGI